jgi:hypothetical protein
VMDKLKEKCLVVGIENVWFSKCFAVPSFVFPVSEPSFTHSIIFLFLLTATFTCPDYMLDNSDLERIWKKGVTDQFKELPYPRIFL